ncbi:hypothetical protein [uncultured Bosea sp.]|uniref:hypothetical protein n=1 Tax=uncultured Bosea sp. TaxID=211457 RepID=UPI0025D5808E|nr:hypothetical protein [uncultured Bosea sp.]
MSSNRSSYQRTVLAASTFSLFAILAGGVAFAIPWLVTILFFAFCCAVASVAGLVVFGGVIGLSRDTMELRGQPYYSKRPRECAAGAVIRLRRKLLSLLPGSPARLRLWPGEWVQVRPFAEIAGTLDEEGRLDGLPFMPEMVRHCGTRHRVFRRVEKIHHYYGPTAPHLRRLQDAVLLGELRCDGAGHGGCQAGCQLIWKEAWLVPSNSAEADLPAPEAADASRLSTFTKVGAADGEERYACQMTELPAATARLSWRDPRHYWRELRSGNVRPGPFIVAVALALFNTAQRQLRGAEAPYREPTDRKTSPKEVLDLQPGEIVRVKTRRQIEETLNNVSKNRGLWFDREMHRFCGGEFRVASVVRTIIDEASGKMLTMGSACIVLAGVSATGEYLGLCPQNELIFWHEIWLERVTSRL